MAHKEVRSENVIVVEKAEKSKSGVIIAPKCPVPSFFYVLVLLVWTAVAMSKLLPIGRFHVLFSSLFCFGIALLQIIFVGKNFAKKNKRDDVRALLLFQTELWLNKSEYESVTIRDTLFDCFSEVLRYPVTSCTTVVVSSKSSRAM